MSFVLSMNTATADGSRALYGISKDGLTIKQLGRLNRFNVPGNAMTLDMGINILFVLFVGNLFGILVASNIGYVLANMFAIAAFVLLRKDRPNWPRPIRLPTIWVPIAVVLFAAFVLFSVVGIGWFQIAGGGAVYGGTKEQDHRLLRPRRLAAALPVPADRPGQGEAALARGDADDAGRGAGTAVAAPGAPCELRTVTRGPRPAFSLVHTVGRRRLRHASAEAYGLAGPAIRRRSRVPGCRFLRGPGSSSSSSTSARARASSRGYSTATCAQVVAVEPVGRDADVDPAGAETVEGTAEAILVATLPPTPSPAQPFHESSPGAALAEIDRVLRPGGGLAIVANVRDESEPLQRAFLDVLGRYRAHPSLESASRPADLLAGDPRFTPPELHRFPHVQQLDAEALVAQAASESSIALLDDSTRADALREFRALVSDAGQIELRYVTEVCTAKRQVSSES